jgi:actin-related protein
MVPGFKKRLEEELRYYMLTMSQYEELKTLESRIRFCDNLNPPNILTWVGASLLASLNDEIGLFMFKTSKEA